MQGMGAEGNPQFLPESGGAGMVGTCTPAFLVPLISGEWRTLHHSQTIQGSERADHAGSPRATSSCWDHTHWSFLLISQADPVTSE